MRVIKDYQIIQRGYPQALEESVRSEIRKGWQPLGPHFIRYGINRSIYYYEQTMVMYDKDHL